MKRLKESSVCAIGLTTLASLSISAVTFADTTVVYVDGDNGVANPPNFGQDGWNDDAHMYLQDALAAADTLLGQSEIDTVEIWVAASTVGYRPDQGANPTLDDPSESFELRENVHIYGGFEGDPSEDDVDDSDPENNVTVLTGELDTAHAYHVVTAIDVDDSARLLGFTITDGVADGSGADSRGGGLYVEDAWPLIHTCTFENNTASSEGGAVYIDSSGAANLEAMELRFCDFDNNGTNGSVSTSEGGAMAIRDAEVRLLRGFYTNNQARSGGAIDIENADVHISHVSFDSNVADGLGTSRAGAVRIVGVDEDRLTFIGNSAMTNNYADTEMGALFADHNGGLIIRNTTVAHNDAGTQYRGVFVSKCPWFRVYNSIFWGNNPDDVNDPDYGQWQDQFKNELNWTCVKKKAGTTLREFEYNCIQDEDDSHPYNGSPWNGGGIIIEDPQFDDNRPSGIHIECTSSVIDAGANVLVADDPYDVGDRGPFYDGNEPAPDFRFAERIVFGVCSEDVDMGAIEFQPCPADLSGDGIVNGADLGILLSNWGECANCSDCPEDLTGDCEVGGADLGTLLTDWGECPDDDCECEGESTGGGGGSTTMGGGDNMFYEWLVTASLQDIIDWLDMMGYWPE